MEARINDSGRKNVHEALDRIINHINSQSPTEPGMFDLVLTESTANEDLFVKHSTCVELSELEDGRFEIEVSWTEHEEYDVNTNELLSEVVDEVEF